MQFTAEEYYRAATERMRQAREIHDSGKNYALAMYCSGLAVACMLRAYRWRKDSSFEGRHDLLELFRAGDLLQIHEEHAQRKRKTAQEIEQSAARTLDAIGRVVTLWHNNLRFASEASLRAYLNRNGHLRGIRGDGIKKNSADLLLAATTIVDYGVKPWNSRRK